MNNFHDWSVDTVQIQKTMPELIEALNRGDYATAEQMATTVVVCARYLVQATRIAQEPRSQVGLTHGLPGPV